MALNREQAQQKVKEILDLARNEKKTLTYQDVMNKLSDLDIDADAIDAVFETLESEGINVINATEDETAVLPADVTGTDMDHLCPGRHQHRRSGSHVPQGDRQGSASDGRRGN